MEVLSPKHLLRGTCWAQSPVCTDLTDQPRCLKAQELGHRASVTACESPAPPYQRLHVLPEA